MVNMQKDTKCRRNSTGWAASLKNMDKWSSLDWFSLLSHYSTQCCFTLKLSGNAACCTSMFLSPHQPPCCTAAVQPTQRSPAVNFPRLSPLPTMTYAATMGPYLFPALPPSPSCRGGICHRLGRGVGEGDRRKRWQCGRKWTKRRKKVWRRVSTQNITHSLSPEMLQVPLSYSSYFVSICKGRSGCWWEGRETNSDQVCPADSSDLKKPLSGYNMSHKNRRLNRITPCKLGIVLEAGAGEAMWAGMVSVITKIH